MWKQYTPSPQQIVFTPYKNSGEQFYNEIRYCWVSEMWLLDQWNELLLRQWLVDEKAMIRNRYN